MLFKPIIRDISADCGDEVRRNGWPSVVVAIIGTRRGPLRELFGRGYIVEAYFGGSSGFEILVNSGGREARGSAGMFGFAVLVGGARICRSC